MPQRMSSIQHILQSDEQIFFLHIPKTAGISFRKIIESQFNPKEIYFGPREYFLEIVQELTLPDFRLIGGHLVFSDGQLLPSKVVYITLFREPVERLISQYEYLRQLGESNPMPKLNSRAEIIREAMRLNFEDWVLQFTDNYITRIFSHDGLSTSSLSFTQDDPFDLDLAKKRLEQFAFLGITEEYQRSIQLLCYTFAWPHQRQQIRFNTTNRKLHSENFPSQLIDDIRERNRNDIDLYGHARQLFIARYKQMLKELQEGDYERNNSILTVQN